MEQPDIYLNASSKRLRLIVDSLQDIERQRIVAPWLTAGTFGWSRGPLLYRIKNSLRAGVVL
jgi:hypothetical protein